MPIPTPAAQDLFRRLRGDAIDGSALDSWPPKWPSILWRGEVAERLMAALLKSAESKDFVGSNPTLSARPLTDG
jgi:hypothetical protein